MQKRLVCVISFLLSLFIGFVSCSDDSGGSGTSLVESAAVGTIGEPAEPIKKSVEISNRIDSNFEDAIIFYYREDGNYNDWGLWLWATGDSANEDDYTSTKGKWTVENGIGYINLSKSDVSESIKNLVAKKKDLNFIIRDDDWKKDPGSDQLANLANGLHFLVISGDSSVYTIEKEIKANISAATMEDKTHLKLTLNVKYGLENSASSNGFSIKNVDGSKEIVITDMYAYVLKNTSNVRAGNFTNEIYVTLASDIDFSETWYISKEGFVPTNGTIIYVSLVMKDYLISLPVCKEGELGLVLNGTTGTFKTWAPVASDVKLLLFTDASKLENPLAETKTPATPDRIIEKTEKTENGIWVFKDVDVSGYKYYKFRITNNGKTNDVCDIYAKAASYEAVAAQITDINTDLTAIYNGKNDKTWGTKEGYYNPFGDVQGTTVGTQKKYTEAIIYEMHIRDWSKYASSGSKGKYLTLASSSKFINHLKDMGITHVQILPTFEWAIYNNKQKDNSEYNWGYNPYHYNVPESRYVTDDYEDGTQAVLELRTLIAKLHEAGIAVNMDVVYNHTSGTGTGSLYDMTVPTYYYRLNEDGTYSNGSGCGNETDSSAPMFKQYMIESLKHWMLDYHVNGFRFDLMGLHEAETMKEIYKALKEIDPNVMVYGEPWTGGSSPVVNGTKKINIDECADADENGVACFNDDFRNAIKGAEYPNFTQGHVSASYSDGQISTGLKGKGFSQKLGRSINYVECHDNLTLSDKLALVILGKTSVKKGGEKIISEVESAGKISVLKAQDKLAAAYVFLSQGTVFINGGQEFMRTKNGDENSYESDDSINGILPSYRTKYTDVENYYKGLIDLRKKYPNSFGSCDTANTETIKTGITKLTTGDFVVYFNASNAEFAIPENKQEEGSVVDVSSGSFEIASSVTKPTSIPAVSALIIKKK